jgi:hypothetical protein
MTDIKVRKKFGIILMIDALGVSNYSIDECKRFLSNQKTIEEVFKIIKTKLPTDYHFRSSHLMMFGDTIVFCWTIDKRNPSKYIEILYGIGSYSAALLQWGIRKGILFRGSIAIGDYVNSESSILGPAIFDASDWYEAANWCGVIVTPKSQLWIDSVFEREKRLSEHSTFFSLLDNLIYKYNVPMSISKNSQTTNEINKEFYVVGWPQGYYTISTGKGETPRERFLSNLYIIPESKEGAPKFYNSIKFFEEYGRKYFPNTT